MNDADYTRLAMSGAVGTYTQHRRRPTSQPMLSGFRRRPSAVRLWTARRTTEPSPFSPFGLSQQTTPAVCGRSWTMPRVDATQSTHWEGCWKTHPECAVNEVQRLTGYTWAQRQEIAELKAELDALRPWAKLGKRAIWEEWWSNYGLFPGGFDYLALRMQLENANYGIDAADA